MLKFFRKYNTVILVFGGVFLMIAFLLPQAISQFAPNFNNRDLFRAGGKTYDTQEMEDLERQMDAVEMTLSPLTGRGFWRQRFGIQNATHWALLGDAARDAGFYNQGGTPEILLRRVFQSVTGQPPTDDQFSQLFAAFQGAGASISDPKFAEEGLRRADAIGRMRESFNSAFTFSDRELALYATQLFNTVSADIAVIPGEAYGATLPEPTEQTLQELYERYRDVAPNDNEFGISYRLLDAVRYEVLLIDRQAISDAILLDPIEVGKFHRQNRESRAYPEALRDARAQVEDDLREHKTDEISRQIQNAVTNVLVRTQSRLERDNLGRRILPPDWSEQRASYDELEIIANEQAARLLPNAEPPARVLRYDDRWYTSEDIRTNDESSALSIQVSGRTVPLSRAFFELSAFEPVQPLPEAQVGVTMRGVTGRASFGSAGDVGFARVLDVRRLGPPDSIELVRDQVRQDAVALAGYEALRGRSGELLAAVLDADGLVGSVFDVIEDGPIVAANALVRLYELFPSIGRAVPVRRFVSRGSVDATDLINTETFAEEVIEATVGWDALDEVSALGNEERTFVLEVPSSRSVAIVHITARQTITQEDLRILRNPVAESLILDIIERDPEKGLFTSLSLPVLAASLDFEDLDPEDQIDPFADPNADEE